MHTSLSYARERFLDSVESFVAPSTWSKRTLRYIRAHARRDLLNAKREAAK